MRMELLQLHYFQKTARLEHMTKAAEELGIAQPALSKTIARLEAELGAALFDRQNRQIRLNRLGKAFLDKVDRALALLEEGRREVADLAGAERGSIHLATNALNRLAPYLREFRSRYPEVRFHVMQIAPASTYEMAALLEKGEVDLIFTAAPFDHPAIREAPVLSAEVRLAVPHGHRLEGRSSVRLAEVKDEPFIEYRDGHPFRRMNEEICRNAGIRPRIVCEVEEPSALVTLVHAGLGVALVPVCRGDDYPHFAMLPIEDPGCRRTFTLAWLEGRYMSAAALELKAFLQEQYDDS